MENQNRDGMRDQGSPDRPLNDPTPGHEGGDRTDPRRTREDDDRDNERQSPRRDPNPDKTPKSA